MSGPQVSQTSVIAVSMLAEMCQLSWSRFYRLIEVTALCEPGWDIGGVVAKVGQGWRLIEVWNVTP